MRDPWRFACPEGHQAVRRVREDSGPLARFDHWYCDTCKAAYQLARDLKTDLKVGA